MRSSSNSQLGTVNWAFIITLILLLVFIWLWYDESDKQDQMTQELKAAKDRANALNAEGIEIANLLEDVSRKVGWMGKNYSFKNIKGPKANFSYTDAGLVAAHANPEGMVPGGEDGALRDGLLKQIIGSAQLSFDRTARIHTTKIGDEKEHVFSTLSAAFKEKLSEVRSRYEETLDPPKPPADPDDAAGKARFQTEKQEYEQKVAAYHKALQDLTAMEGWTEYNERIRAPGTWGDPSTVGVKVGYFSYTDTGDRTLQAAVEDIPSAFKRMGQEIAAYIDAANEKIRQQAADQKAKQEALDQAQAALQTEQEERTTEVSQLQTQLTEANEGRNRNMIEKTNAEQELARVRDEASKTEVVLKRDIEARKEALRLIKAKRDLVIARDDPDGTVLVANRILRTATIDIGSADKAYVGQKFVVSNLDRAGNRVNRGELVIVRVTGKHSAQARIVSGMAGDGDRIHNPFFQRGERVHVYLAAKMDKWPKAIAKARLAQLNVVVQDAMDGSTDYVVVPNSWAAPVAAVGDDEEEDGGGEAAMNPLEEIQKQARVFGASVVTERMLDAFLDY